MIKGNVSLYSDSVLRNGMIHSLRGSAAETMRHLEPGTTVDAIIS